MRQQTADSRAVHHLSFLHLALRSPLDESLAGGPAVIRAMVSVGLCCTYHCCFAGIIALALSAQKHTSLAGLLFNGCRRTAGPLRLSWQLMYSYEISTNSSPTVLAQLNLDDLREVSE